VAQNGCSWTQCQADDVAFARALVETIASDLCVDPRRVYAAGGSNGGMFTWELGRRNAEAPVFAALAPLVGLPHAGYLAADGALPVLLLTGTEDPVVPPGDWEDASPTTSSSGQDRFYYTGATAITRSWARARGCDVTVDALPYDDGDPRTDCRTYCADADVPPVLDCRAEQGHVYGLSWTWPLVLDFFDAHAG
jgi:poly(3-hydroxybutyrate) depolymerase